MSQEIPKQAEKSKGQQRYEELMAQIAEITKKMEAFKPPTENIVSSKTKESHRDHIRVCKDCGDEALEYAKEKGFKTPEEVEEEKKKAFKERASYPLQCVGCGMGVKIEEESCPACGNKRAKPR